MPVIEMFENIRVVIGANDGLVHENVKITCTGFFSVFDGENIFYYNAGEIFQAEKKHYIIKPENQTCRLEIVGLERNGGSPKYRGTFEISFDGSGFIIVNELPLEEYLYAVIPSEMPSSYGIAASMVQSVAARSYAVFQMRENRFHEYGAHVDDSVQSQVYNSIPENEISVAAVRATHGQVLTYNGEVILANYFSTSGGTTANYGEVWGEKLDTPEYLRARAQGFFANPGDLRTEAAAAVFFKNSEVHAFEREFPWFRWQVSMTVSELSERINEKTETFGTLRHMEVLQRGQGGNIMEMIFYGTEASFHVFTEYNIRALLYPGNIPVTRQNGSLSGELSLLPSAFFTMDFFYDDENNLQSVTFYGGGNGHGVGMSQNGVRALLDMGFSYLEILSHYYPGTVIF